MQAATWLGLVLPAASALGCPYCAQDRGADLLIAAISLLPLALAAGVFWHVRRISEQAGGNGISSAGTLGRGG
jgi:hypothetical protein